MGEEIRLCEDKSLSFYRKERKALLAQIILSPGYFPPGLDPEGFPAWLLSFSRSVCVCVHILQHNIDLFCCYTLWSPSGYPGVCVYCYIIEVKGETCLCGIK